MVLVGLVVALSLPLAVPAEGAAPQASAKKPAPTATLEVKVTDRRGAPIADADVSVQGASARDGQTDATGAIVLRTMTAGTYRIRVEREGFVTLEKEATLKAGAPYLVEAALSPAPPAPPPPKPVESNLPPALAAGLARALSIPDLVSERLPGREAVERIAVGCSGATATEVLRLRDGLESHTHADADEVLYLVAGEAVLTLGSSELKVGPGWYSLVPRGISHTLVRQGRNPIVLLSVVSGPPCPASALKD